MALAPGRYPIGPDTGSLRLRTKREGVAAKVGHDLLIEFAQWSGTVEIGGAEAETASVRVEVELGSFTVIEGTGGVAPLSTRDRKDISGTAMKLLDVERHPTAKFASTAVTGGSDAAGAVEGTLELRGGSGTVRMEVTGSGPSAWTATGSVLQSDYGIKPYRALLGTLRLADAVDIVAEVHVSL